MLLHFVVSLLPLASWGTVVSYRIVESALTRVVQDPAFRDVQQGRQSRCTIVDRAIDAATTRTNPTRRSAVTKIGLG